MQGWCPSSLTAYSYYFTTCILVLKFVTKWVFFEEIQDLHFLRKRGILVLTSLNLEKKGLIWCPVFYCEKGGSFGLKSQCFTAKKGGSSWTEKSVFYREKGVVVLSWRVIVLTQKRRSFSNWRTRMGTTFSSEWGSRRWCPVTFWARTISTPHFSTKNAFWDPKHDTATPAQNVQEIPLINEITSNLIKLSGLNKFKFDI